MTTNSTGRAQELRWDAATAAHLHRRAGFGASSETLERSVEQGLEATVDELFARREHDPALHAGIERLLGVERIEPVQAWWLALILQDRAPLVERVTLMWHDHFATSFDKVKDARLMHAQNELFRTHGLGDFRTLLHAVAKDPAMLVFLDGNANKKGEPNENFAREVLELFGLGINNYTEDDIQEAARAFTGWGVHQRQFVNRSQHHDAGEKTIFGSKGRFVGEEAIDLVLAQPACARHVARRLLCEFALPDPSAKEVAEWAELLVASDWSIASVLAQLFRSELFFSSRSRRSRISGPIEFVVGTALALGARPTPADVARNVTDMAQAPLRPPSVKGWDGGRTWIHAGTWLARTNFGTELAFESGAQLDLAAAYGNPAREELAETALALLLPDGAAPGFARVLREAERACASTEDALRRVTALILTSPEYHLV